MHAGHRGGLLGCLLTWAGTCREPGKPPSQKWREEKREGDSRKKFHASFREGLGALIFGGSFLDIKYTSLALRVGMKRKEPQVFKNVLTQSPIPLPSP